MRVNKLVRLKLSRNYRGPEAYSRRKDYLDHFSVAQVIIARVFSFFIFNYIVLFSFCAQIFVLFTRCEVAENDNCTQWLQTIDSES